MGRLLSVGPHVQEREEEVEEEEQEEEDV